MRLSRLLVLAGLATLIVGCGQTTLAATPGPIVALGDSLTFGYGAYSLGQTTPVYGPVPDHSYPWDMARDLGQPVINAGISGDTARQAFDPTWDPGRHRPANVQLPALLAQHPRLMVVFFGTNEAYRQFPISQTVDDLHALLGQISGAGVPIILVGSHVDCNVSPCAPPGPGNPPRVYTAAWDQALTDLASQYHAGLVLDVMHGFEHADTYDWIHCSAQGYQLMADRIEPYVRARLGI